MINEFCESQGLPTQKPNLAAGPLMPAMRTRMTTIPAASAPSHALTSERPNMRLPDLWSSLSSSEALEAELCAGSVLGTKAEAACRRRLMRHCRISHPGLIDLQCVGCTQEGRREQSQTYCYQLCHAGPSELEAQGEGRLLSSQILEGIEAKYTPSKCHESLIIFPQIFRPSYSPLTLLLCFSVATVLLWSIQWFSSRMLLCKYTGSHMRLPFICCKKRTYKGEHHRQRVGLNPRGFHDLREMAIS